MFRVLDTRGPDTEHRTPAGHRTLEVQTLDMDIGHCRTRKGRALDTGRHMNRSVFDASTGPHTRNHVWNIFQVAGPKYMPFNFGVVDQLVRNG